MISIEKILFSFVPENFYVGLSGIGSKYSLLVYA
jgi:hypothetical protein